MPGGATSTNAAQTAARPLSILVAAISALAPAGAASAQVIALANATVIDGTGAAPQTGVTIVMEKGRICRHGPRRHRRRGACSVVDLTGRYITPGIINGHGHVGPGPHEEPVRQYASYGVTTTTSMGSDPDAIIEYKARPKPATSAARGCSP